MRHGFVYVRFYQSTQEAMGFIGFFVFCALGTLDQKPLGFCYSLCDGGAVFNVPTSDEFSENGLVAEGFCCILYRLALVSLYLSPLWPGFCSRILL